MQCPSINPLGTSLMELCAILSDATDDFVNKLYKQNELHQFSESHDGVLRMRVANAELADNLINGFHNIDEEGQDKSFA